MNSLITSKGSCGISFDNLVKDDQVQENPPLLLALVTHLAERTSHRGIDAETDFVKKVEKIQYHIQEKVSKAVRSDFKCSRKLSKGSNRLDFFNSKIFSKFSNAKFSQIRNFFQFKNLNFFFGKFFQIFVKFLIFRTMRGSKKYSTPYNCNQLSYSLY